MPAFLTKAEAQQLVDARFTKVGGVVTSSGRSFSAWTETWRRTDGADATPADIHAFELLPRGQGHSVTANGPVVTLHCSCDSGG